MESFGKRFCQYRKRANLTQEEIATKLNITAQAVSKWEKDISAPDISLLVEIADIFGITTDELLGKAPKTILVPQEQRKPTNQLMLKIKVLSNDGDNVTLALPFAMVKVFVASNSLTSYVNIGSDALKSVDFAQVIALCEQGILGKIVDVQTADGDRVEIWVE